MPETNIERTTISDLKNNQTNYSVDAVLQDSPQDSKETEYTITNWSSWLGYYKQIPELQCAIDTKATWTVGKGYTADPMTTLILDRIRGNGVDTFNTILENLIRTYHICGDAFAEIITDEKGYLINLKPLDPGSIKIVANRKGRIIRYEQTNRIQGKSNLKFDTERIFHLSRNRVADEIHGQGIVSPVENIILMRNEAMTDWKTVLHRNVAPVLIWHLDTDNQTQINEFKAKIESARENVENIFIPKGAVVPEVFGVAPNASLNPLAWIEQLNNYFWQAVGVPQIVVGGTGAITEAAVKIAYLAFEQTIEEEQLYIEEQVLSQINLLINLEFPASLQNEMISDKPKVENRGIEGEQANQPNDTTAEMEGRK